MIVFALLIIAVTLAVLLAIVVASAYGIFASRPKVRPSFALRRGGTATGLDRLVDALEQPDDDSTGCIVLSDNLDAFAARAFGARQAGRSLDLMYYQWRGDLTGTLLANEVIAAADRGVRVRMLVDDINTRGKDAVYAALSSHPRIEVRLFNPTRARGRGLRRGIEMLLRLLSLNRRMHNKAWIGDGRVAIVGGRNIGDAYFDAANRNFRDLDLMMVGQAVADVEAIFDAFWNCGLSLPVPLLNKVRKGGLRSLRRRIGRRCASPSAQPYLERAEARIAVEGFTDATDRLHWSKGLTVVSDPPEKVQDQGEEKWLTRRIRPMIDAAEKRFELISPYFIPGEKGAAWLESLRERGIAVAILTNSLAATDVAAVHGAYAPCRVRLLKAGIRLFELQPYEARPGISVFGSRGASLHTKAFAVDEAQGFIGSFNFDPRSASLNTEMGVLFDDPVLFGELSKRFAMDTAPTASFEVTLRQGALHWRGVVAGRARDYDSEPEASLARRLLARVVGLLPIASQL